jgi:hypothetical protein
MQCSNPHSQARPVAAYCLHVPTKPNAFACCLQVQYIAQHVSSMLRLPEVRQALTKLPAVLLMQLLSSEALEVDQVGFNSVGCNCWRCMV